MAAYACAAFVLSNVSLGAYVILFCALLSTRSKREAAGKYASGLLAWAHSWRCRAEATGALDIAVRERMARERVNFVRKLSQRLVHPLALAATVHAVANWTVFSCTGWLELDDATGLEALNPMSFGSIILHLWVCMIWTAFPQLVTTRSIDLMYALYSVWWICRNWLMMYPDDLAVLVPYSYVQRVAVGLIVCNAGVTSKWNVIVMLGNCAALGWNGVNADPSTLLFRLLSFFMMQEILYSIMIAVFLMCVDYVVRATLRYILEIKASSQTQVTVLRLLSALCDAVVTLGPDLRISARAPKLANLLLQGSSTRARALEGTWFLDLMAATDQERFHHFMARAPDWADSCTDPMPAQALNVHLRDSSGTDVQVQLFHSPFLDLNDQVGHLIGICEVGDSGRQWATAGEGGAREVPAAQSQGRGAGGRPESLDSASTTRCATDLDGDISLTCTSVGHPSASSAANPRPQASVDFVAPLRTQSEDRVSRRAGQQREVNLAFETLHFTIWQSQSSTPVISANLMELENLQQWVAEWGSCRAWLQDFVNAALRPVNAASWPSRAGPPSSLSFHVAFRGTCALPRDILSRGLPVPSGGISATASTEGTERRRAPSSIDNRGPPTRLAVSKVRLSRQRRLAPVDARASVAFHSDVSPVAYRPQHPQVQPSLLGAPAGPVAEPSGARRADASHAARVTL